MTTNPLKINTTTSPNSLKEMTTAEMDYMAYLVQTAFAALTTGTGTVSINPANTSGLSEIGNLTDYELDAAPGTQIGTNYAGANYGGAPNYTRNFQTFYGGGYGGFAGPTYQGFFATQYTLSYATNIYGTTYSSNYTSNFQTFYGGGGGFGGFGGAFYTGFFQGNFVGRSNTTITEYHVYQDLGTEIEASLDYPLKYITAQGVKPMTNTQFNAVVIDHMLDNMVAGGIGSYEIATSTPAGGTWTSRGAITDAASGGDTVYTLWQKTADTAPTTVRPLKERLNGNVYDLIELTDAEMENWLERFQNQIIESGIGEYRFQASTPTPGTWAQVGNDITETEQQTYVGTYAPSYQARYVSASKTTNATLKLWVRTA